MKNYHTAKEALGRLLGILDELREKCPWDKKQTIESLRHLTIEEVYELSEAILQGDFAEIKKELGDVLLHLAFYSKIAQEQNQFNIAEVINELCEKLIYRHPHIYANLVLEDEEEVKRNWEQLKLREALLKGKKASVFAGIPRALPSLVKAYRIQEKAQGVDLGFKTSIEALSQVTDQLQAFDESTSIEMKEEKWGDLLFALVGYARLVGINSDDALNRANEAFIRRVDDLENSF